MGYQWSVDPKGQYVDGHEREDVVNYWQNVFLPGWASAERYMRTYTRAGEEELSSNGRHTIVWFHDESTFYAHDCQRKRWIHKDTNPVPYAKGEGASLMVADFVSADYGYLRSRDGKCSARRLFKAGKNRDGYFMNTEILEQVKEAMEIVKESYPDNNHFLSMTMQQLTLSMLMMLSQHVKCLNFLQKHGGLRSINSIPMVNKSLLMMENMPR